MTTSVNQGESTTLTSQWYQYLAGPPVDLDAAPSIQINSAASGSAILGPTTSGVLHQATGLYSFQWSVSTTIPAGDYVALWNGTYMSSAVQSSEIVTVNAYDNSVFLTWCDITLQEDLINGQGNILPVNPVTWVKNVTGSVLTTAQIMSAQQVLNMFSNYTPEASGFNMNPRDLMLLRYGLAYQAVWQPSQPGLLQKMNLKQLSQDGLSTTLDDSNGVEQSNMLAPLAQRSLKQLSWRKSRSLRVRTPFIDDQTPLSSDPDAEANDLYERWVDMYNFGYRGSSVP